LRILLGVLITGFSLYLAARNVSIEEIKSAFVNASPVFVLWGFLSVVANTLGKVFRWRVLMGPVESEVSFSRAFMSLLAGQALNNLYPARVGDITRAYLANESGSGRVFLLGTIVLEKLFDTVSYAILFIVLLLLFPLPGWINDSVYVISVLSLLGLILILILARRLDRFTGYVDRFIGFLPGRFQEKLQRWARSGISSLEILQGGREIVLIGLWSFLIWGTAVLTNYLTLLALHIHLPITASILVLVVLQVSVSLPSVPGWIGVFEYLCILSLALFGISQAKAFSYGILLHVLVLVPSTLTGLIFLGFFTISGKQVDKIDA
jgi:uncharacterized protein (TIRG00374 family)